MAMYHSFAEPQLPQAAPSVMRSQMRDAAVAADRVVRAAVAAEGGASLREEATALRGIVSTLQTRLDASLNAGSVPAATRRHVASAVTTLVDWLAALVRDVESVYGDPIASNNVNMERSAGFAVGIRHKLVTARALAEGVLRALPRPPSAPSGVLVATAMPDDFESVFPYIELPRGREAEPAGELARRVVAVLADHVVASTHPSYAGLDVATPLAASLALGDGTSLVAFARRCGLCSTPVPPAALAGALVRYAALQSEWPVSPLSSAEEAEGALAGPGARPGDFVVRFSGSTASLAVSRVTAGPDGHVEHMRVTTSGDGARLRADGAVPVASLSDLVLAFPDSLQRPVFARSDAPGPLRAFHGNIGYDEAVARLAGCPYGTYLFRLSLSKPGSITCARVERGGAVEQSQLVCCDADPADGDGGAAAAAQRLRIRTRGGAVTLPSLGAFLGEFGDRHRRPLEVDDDWGPPPGDGGPAAAAPEPMAPPERPNNEDASGAAEADPAAEGGAKGWKPAVPPNNAADEEEGDDDGGAALSWAAASDAAAAVAHGAAAGAAGTSGPVSPAGRRARTTPLATPDRVLSGRSATTPAHKGTVATPSRPGLSRGASTPVTAPDAGTDKFGADPRFRGIVESAMSPGQAAATDNYNPNVGFAKEGRQ